MSFIGELKRRNVFKVGTAYLVVAWLILQVLDVVGDILELPGWFGKFLLVFLSVGFPVVLLVSWAFEVSAAGVRRTSVINGRTSGSSRSAAAGYLVTALGGGLIGASFFWLLSGDQDVRWFKDHALPEIDTKIAAGDWNAAFAMAEVAAERVGPEYPELNELWPRLSWLATFESEPPGATVSLRAYHDDGDSWKELGQTPLRDIRIPFGLSRIRLERDGFLPLYRTIGGGLSQLRLPKQGESPSNLFVGTERYFLDTSDTLPEGKVRVPRWSEIIDGKDVEFADYFLDRYEVTNLQFKAFIEAGGYERADLWEPIIQDGQLVPWDEAMRLFTDRTGRLGPSTWTAGDFPLGEEDFPVAGVSWYEASAYARFMGQELPTAYHWRRARSLAAVPWLMAESNVASSGPRAVSASTAMSFVGAYDLAGNVREWTATSGQVGKVIAGGSWNDEPFIAFQSLTSEAPPLDRSPANGFRLAISRDPPDVRKLAKASAPLPPELREPEMQPVGAETYAAYSSFFRFENVPLNASIDAEVKNRLWLRQKVSFDSPYGDDREILYLYLPSNASPPYQTIMFWPGAGAYLVDSIDTQPVIFDFILQSGRAVAVPVYAGTFERRNDRGPTFAPRSAIAYRDNLTEGVIDLKRSIDYMATRSDIDTASLGYFGHSQGGINAPIALAQESRLRVAVSYVGFIPPQVMEPVANPVHALPRVNVPVLLLSGEFDSTAPLENAKRYFSLLGTPESDKKQVVAPGGHFVPRELLVRETLDWFDRYLGPPKKLQR